MIKLGVFGDSSANHGDVNYMWPTLISDFDSGIVVANHGFPGSSLWYTYEQLQEHAHKYSHIVILVTMWGRYKLKNIESPGCHTTGAASIESTLRNSNRPEINNILSSLLNWMIYCRDDKQEKFYHQLTIDHIYNSLKDNHQLLMIPCFGQDASGIVPGSSHASMIDISFKDKEIPTWTDDVLIDDPRSCHLNRENNKIFAKKIINWMHNKHFEINLNDFVVGEPWEVKVD